MVAGDVALRRPGADEGVERVVRLRPPRPDVRDSVDLREGASECVQAFMAAFAAALVESASVSRRAR